MVTYLFKERKSMARNSSGKFKNKKKEGELKLPENFAARAISGEAVPKEVLPNP